MTCLLQEISQNDVENVIIIRDFSIKELKTMKNFITKVTYHALNLIF